MSPVARLIVALGLCLLMSPMAVIADDLPQSSTVEVQPMLLQVKRLREAMDYLGEPFAQATKDKLAKAAMLKDDAEARALVQEALDPYCLFGVAISPESRVKVMQGPAKPELVEAGWRQFLVKVVNKAGVTAPLRAVSANALPLRNSPDSDLRNRWLELGMFNGRPLSPNLSGIDLEYRVIQLYTRERGKRAAVIAFNVGQGSQDIGFRNDVPTTFTISPSVKVTLNVLDEDGKPTTAGFEFRDKLGRVYPSQAKRLAPDFAFHPQVYRSTGESLTLPAGAYSVKVTRGPEYHALYRNIEVREKPITATFELRRWIDPSKRGYWSGDHHIHAAGCAHYQKPTEGVHAKDMFRHIRGEDLKVGANLTWGPCFDYQKQFFTGKDASVSRFPYLLRYDIEVSGFGSHRSGHLCLLRLKQQIPPGGDSKNHWPTLGLNTLRWAKKQGAVVGPAHSGWGLGVPSAELPNYILPPYDSIGANEYIVDVTHEVPGPDGKPTPAVDFMSTVDTPYVWELNMWYHTLNCGYRTRISGETDFPCIYGERVGLGRSYVKLDKLSYDGWCEGIRRGAAYVSEGNSHLLDMTVRGEGKTAVMGEAKSELRLTKPGTVRVRIDAAAMLGKNPLPHVRRYEDVIKQAGGRGSRWAGSLRPFWHIERVRIGKTRRVPVEVVINSRPAGKQVIEADGRMQTLSFDVAIKHSSWVAVRVLGSSHTNPVFVLVDGKPIRASKRSAKWCLDGVDRCWSQKKRTYHASEMAEAEAAYAHARQAYRRIMAEAVAD